MTKQVLVLSCEHGGASVPSPYRCLFDGRAARAALRSHRGSDLGALSLARSLQRSFHVPLHASVVTRLLVDLNRSLGHPQLFSEFTRSLDSAERAALLERHYFPHRNHIESWIEAQVRRGKRVLHVAVHSFAPRIDGRLRKADIGLLYDPSRPGEKALCEAWKNAIQVIDPDLRIRRNYPYLGKSDGLVTHLRKCFGARRYMGVELESNQALLGTDRGVRRAAGSVTRSLRSVISAGS